MVVHNVPWRQMSLWAIISDKQETSALIDFLHTTFLQPSAK